MTCFMCKGGMFDGYSNFTVDMGKCIIIIKNVPSKICSQCGENSFDDETALRLEKIARSLAEPIRAEVAIVSYTEHAA